MLAGDLPQAPSEFYNYVRPIDVNNDGHESTLDLLAVVNSLTATGPRSLAASGSAAEGEDLGAATAKYYIDPNNDQTLNTLDLLMVINELTAEGADPPLLANFKFVPVALGTNTPITSIPEGGHYELRVLTNDTGIQDFSGQHRDLLHGNGNDAIGVFDAYFDMFWDRAQTDLQINETQTIVLNGSLNAATRFTLTFTDIDNTQQTTNPITFVPLNRELTAQNIRNELVALSKIGTSAVGALSNVEVVSSPTFNNRFTVRFINDEANKNFANLSGTITAGGGTGVTVTEVVAGDPTSLVSFKEMFRPRLVLDPNFDPANDVPDPINDDPVTGLLYYTFFADSFALPQTDGVTRAGNTNAPATVPEGPKPGTREVEVFRLRMTAKEKLGIAPVTFAGAYPDVSTNLGIALVGFNGFIPEDTVNFVSGTLNIVELVSAVDDAASINEGTNGGALNNALVNVLGNDQDNNGPADLVLSSFTQPGAGQGTVTQEGSQLRYTVPNADFSGVVTFTYTIRDGVNAALTDVGTVTVTVNATNDPPVNTVPISVPNPLLVAEDAPAGLVFGGATAISIADVDAGAASVSIRLQATNGTLKLVSLPGTLAIVGDGTNDLTIVGSIADINPALSGLKFAPTLNYNGPAQITVTTNDNGNSGSPGPLTDVDVINISVTPVNDAPENMVPGPQTVDEMVILTFSTANGNRISVSDVDAGAAGSTNPNLTVTLSTTQGGVLHAVTGGGATIGGQDSANLTISGTLAQVNAALDGMTYQKASPASDLLTVLTSDNGNTGAGGILTDSDSITIDVLPTTRPRAIADVFPPIGQTIFEPAGVLLLDVLANDLIHPGESKILVSVDPPNGTGNGSTLPVGNQVQYTPPDADFFGTVTFNYTMNETDTVGGPSDGPSTATVTLTITNVNDPPVGNPDEYSTNEDQTLNVSAALGVLLDDTDADNRPGKPVVDTLTAQLVQNTPAAAGSVNLSADGAFTFTPAANFNGQTSFTYRVFDGTTFSGDTTVTITVDPVNDNPVANPDSYPATEDVVLSVDAASGVLLNDTDVDNPGNTNAGLTATLTQQPPAGQGTVILASDGSFTWTPTVGANFFGNTSFKYRAVDPTALQSPEATVTIQVSPVNDAPVAGDVEFTVEEGAVLLKTAAEGLRLSVTDPDQPGGFTGSIALVPASGPAQGTLVLNADGSFTYTPPALVVNPFDVSFRYTAFDGALTSNEGTVTIHVIPFNDPPVARNDGPFSATEDQPLTIPAPGVLGDNGFGADSDEETPPAGLRAQIVAGSLLPAGAGSVVLNEDGSFTYTPTAHFFTLGTPVTFRYRVIDGPNGTGEKPSNEATVTINVAEVNDDPVANPDFADPVIRNLPNQLLPSALANDNAGVDIGAVPGDVLSISSVDALTAAGNTVTRVGNDLFYNENVGHLGLDTFQYTISDGRGGTATATYTVNVVEFVPKDVSGTVYVAGKPLANAEIHLNGTNVLGIPVFTQLVTFTDEFGHYSFDDLRPGNYTLTEITPRFLKDGSEPSSHPNPLVKSIADDLYTFRWDTPESIVTGSITGLDFNELRIDATQLDGGINLANLMLASSADAGLILAVGPGDQNYWSYGPLAWNVKASLQLEFGVGGTIPSLLLTIGGVTKRIYQDPANNTGTGSPSSPAAGSPARFVIVGSTTSNEYIICLIGTLSDFGFVASTGAPPETGEGESAPQMSDGQYRESADQVFADKAWA